MTSPELPLRERIVLYGDSLTQRSFEANGWGAALADEYSRTADVFNRGYGGYNSRWCAREETLRAAFGGEREPTRRALMSCVMLGTNDATRLVDKVAERSNRVSVSVSDYGDYMRRIVNRAAMTSKFVFVMSPPVVDEDARRLCQIERYGESWVGGPWEDRRPEIEAFGAMAKTVANEVNASSCGAKVVFVDVYAATKKLAQTQMILCDGVHFTSLGQEVVHRELRAAMTDAGVPSGEDLLPDFPYGHELRNPEDPTVDFPNGDGVFERHVAKRKENAREM
jgi:lysophospholipase L1-like esterase